MRRFIFVGRMVREKGRDMIIDLLETINNDRERQKNISIDICGQGPGEIQLTPYLNVSRLSYHGRCDAATVGSLFAQADFSMMPSRFWETFGKSALESLASQTPVIGIKQAGLIAFIHDDLQCTHDTQTFLDRVRDASMMDPQTYQSLIQRGNTQAQSYTHTQRNKQLTTLVPANTTVLILSDYLNPLGGIENHITDLTHALIDQGCHVSRDGSTLGSGSLETIKKWIAVAIATICFPQRFRSRRQWKKTIPDTVRRHSVSRWRGPRGLLGIPKSQNTLITLHDFGYVAPFARYIDTINDIPASSTLSSRLHTFWSHTASQRGYPKKIIRTLGVLYKRTLTRSLRWCIKRGNYTVIVPSAALLPFCKQYARPDTVFHIFAPGYITDNIV